MVWPELQFQERMLFLVAHSKEEQVYCYLIYFYLSFLNCNWKNNKKILRKKNTTAMTFTSIVPFSPHSAQQWQRGLQWKKEESSPTSSQCFYFLCRTEEEEAMFTWFDRPTCIFVSQPPYSLCLSQRHRSTCSPLEENINWLRISILTK